ncbi:PREDICTED: zinc finger protein 512B [Ceratosolen solmsi marchali]|uniref:Zinc finger protein 512B n=1 Tax=Ceratosolen solmsi marchali TaxID=326594 RepID=A0AAJ6YCF3_9HYME|nr:PREDICTED: zinc finger protein 512B [Ceratosolen solmsi marchali]
MLRILALVAFLFTMTKSSQHFSYGNAPLYPIHPKLISQSVQLKEVPTKIIKITKTVAVKVPVPYPVKVPHHIPIPVPVHHPVAVPVPQIVKVPHHVPVEIEKPVPVELPQQVPLYLTKPVPLPHPVPVPQPITINRPVYYPVPHAVPYSSHNGHEVHEQPQYEVHASLFTRTSDFDSKEENEGNAKEGKTESQESTASQYNFDYFRPSQPDYSSEH